MSVAPGGAFGLSVDDAARAFPRLGAGLALEGGVLLRDRTSISLQVMATFLPANTLAVPFPLWMVGGGPSVDWLREDGLSFGTGLHLQGWPGYQGLVVIQVPARVRWWPLGRGPDQVARQGLVLGLQLGAGVGLSALSSTFPINFTFSALVTVGYGWW